VPADDRDGPGAAGQRGVEGELEIGLVLLRRVGLDLAARGPSRRQLVEIDRVEIPDHQIDRPAERHRLREARVGRDHERLGGQSRRDLDRDRIAAREHDRGRGSTHRLVPVLEVAREISGRSSTTRRATSIISESNLLGVLAVAPCTEERHRVHQARRDRARPARPGRSVAGVDVTRAMTEGGHEQVVLVADAASGLRAVIAIHSTALGPGAGRNSVLAVRVRRGRAA